MKKKEKNSNGNLVFNFVELEKEIRYPKKVLITVELEDDSYKERIKSHPKLSGVNWNEHSVDEFVPNTLKGFADYGIRWEKAVFLCHRTDSDEPIIITFHNTEQRITIESDKLSVKECSTAISMVERQGEIDTNNPSRDIANACMFYMEISRCQKFINEIIISKAKGGCYISFSTCIEDLT